MPRRAPFSTPPLVKGMAPRPVSFVASVGGTQGPAARVQFTYDQTTGQLRYEATTSGLGTDRVVALTLQRSLGDSPGAVVAQFLSAGQAGATSELMLRGVDREELVAGHLFMHLYTRQAPLGAGRARLTLP